MEWRLQCMVAMVAILGCHAAHTNDNSTSNRNTTSDSLVASVNDFGFRMLLNMDQRGDGNAVLGAASLVGVLGMAMMGSVGVTYDELAHALGFPQDILSSGTRHAALGGMLRATGGGQGLAQAVAAAKKARVRPTYRNLLHRFYQADVLDAVFADSENTTNMINEWVSARTAGRVPRLVRRPLPANTQLVLLSAHHFRAAWEKPFLPEYTRPMEFKTQKGNVTVDLMLNLGHFEYVFSEEYHCHMVSLPYRDGAGALYALMPLPARHSLAEVLARLDWKIVDEMRANMTNQSVVVRFPKMQLRSEDDLRAPLQDLGVGAMFDSARANFALALEGDEPRSRFSESEDELVSRAAAGDGEAGAGREQLRASLRRLEARAPPVHVDAVLHQAYINFDEWGTEAAAASGGILARSARRFIADAPFLLFIRDASSGLVTFSAIVNEPITGANDASVDSIKNNTNDS